MYLTRHQAFRGPCWAVDGYWLPDEFHLDFMLQRSLADIRDALANARSDEPAEGGARRSGGGHAGSLGGRCDLPAQPRGPHGGIRNRGHLRQGLQRRAGRGVLQVERLARDGSRRSDSGAARQHLERAGAGARAGAEPRGRDCRLHRRQRRVVAQHRGRKPALPAAGEGLQRLVRTRSGHRHRRARRHARFAAAPHHRTRRCDGVRRGDPHLSAQAIRSKRSRSGCSPNSTSPRAHSS